MTVPITGPSHPSRLRAALLLAALLLSAWLSRAFAQGTGRDVHVIDVGVSMTALADRLSEDAVDAVRDGARWVDHLATRCVRTLKHVRAVRLRLAWHHAVRMRTEAAFSAMLARGSVLSHAAVGGRRIALTLDDGPSLLTPDTLAILARHRVHVTFFLVGSHAHRYPQFVRDIREAGHEIENHTWSHELGYPYTPTQFTRSPLLHQLDEIRRTDRGLHERTRFIRAPGGLFGPCAGTVEAARELHKVIVNWDVAGDTPGWQHIAKGRIVGMAPRDVLGVYERTVMDGSIILMHPENKQDAPYTLGILERFVVDMQKRGYRFVTLDEMLQPTSPPKVALRH